MFVSAEEVGRMERLYGKPAEDSAAFEMGAKEWSVLRRSQRKGRSHDVTLYVRRGQDLAVIAKHSYPPGVYRAPSGGVKPGESMEAGIAREAMEEIGVEIRLLRYLLRERVQFSRNGEVVHWTTHVFTAEALSEGLEPHDLGEIREARWMPVADLSGKVGDALAASASAGLRYRAYLHKKVMEQLARQT